MANTGFTLKQQDVVKHLASNRKNSMASALASVPTEWFRNSSQDCLQGFIIKMIRELAHFLWLQHCTNVSGELASNFQASPSFSSQYLKALLALFEVQRTHCPS